MTFSNLGKTETRGVTEQFNAVLVLLVKFVDIKNSVRTSYNESSIIHFYAKIS